jgi:hypothetical protein
MTSVETPGTLTRMGKGVQVPIAERLAVILSAAARPLQGSGSRQKGRHANAPDERLSIARC